jgi:uncharacterized membrane protein
VDATLRELLDLSFRWLHVIAGILWIGNSMLFNWLDRSLLPPADGRADTQGQIWLLHSGGFYDVRKELDGWDRARPLHWFKWQAYTTWISGFVLLVLVYYLAGGALLVAPGEGALPHGWGVAVGIGVLVVGWVVYDRAVAPLLRSAGGWAAVVGLALVMALAWGLGQLFTGRAAWLHVGALLGTMMAANVGHHIMPSQRKLVDAVERGERPEQGYADRAKERSIHNNYITYPVVVLMLSSHFPAFYGHPQSWLLLGVIVAGGAGVRHAMNLRFTYERWVPVLVAIVVATLLALYLIGRPGGAMRPAAATGEPVTFAEVEGIIAERCTVCHAREPQNPVFGPAPGGVAFDSPAEIRRWARRIRARSVETHTMPPGNMTGMTAAEREKVGRWIAQGARVE